MSRSASQTPNLMRKFGGKPASGIAGGVDEDFFYENFSKVPSIEINSLKELEEKLTEITKGLNLSSEDWEKRIKFLKSFQSLTNHFSQFPDSIPMIRDAHLGLQSCLADLRSQVVREACITVALMAHILKIRVESTADFLVPQLFVLVPNSARIISSSASICLTIIVRNIQSSRVLHHILSSMTSKSNITRRFASSLLESVCSEESFWTNTAAANCTVLTKQISAVGNALDKGVSDSDQDTRASCRRALADLAVHWPMEVGSILDKMDPGRRSTIEKELTNNHPIALQSLQSAGVVLGANRYSSSVQSSSNGKKRTTIPPSTLKLGSSSLRRGSANDCSSSNYNSLNRPRTKPSSSTNYSSSTLGNRSKTSNLMTTSQINTSTTASRLKASRGSNSSISSVGKTSATSSATNKRRQVTNGTSSNTSSNNNGRMTPNTQYKYKPSGSVSASLPRRKNMLAGGVNNGGPNSNYLYPPNGDYGRRRSDTSDDNMSEASSIDSCSEISSRSSLRAQRPTENVSEMIRQLSSYQWSDKRDGLINLQNLLNGGRLSPSEVKKIIEVLNTLFGDTKSKIFPLFLSTVQLLIETHQKYLSDWLYPLLLNLLSRQAGETVTGRQRAIQDTLTTVRSAFPLDAVISQNCRVLTDSYQNTSSNVKLKLATLNYLKTLIILAPGSVLHQILSALTPTVNILSEWAQDSKWSEIRKLSTGILTKLQEIHPEILETICHCLSVTVRHKIASIVKNYINSSNSNLNGSGIRTNYKSRSRKNSATSIPYTSSMASTATNSQIPASSHTQHNPISQEDIDLYIRKNTEDLQALSTAYDTHDGGMGAYGATNQDFGVAVGAQYGGVQSARRGSGLNSTGRPVYRSQLSDPQPPQPLQSNPYPRQAPSQQASNPPVGGLDPNYMINRYHSSIRNTGYAGANNGIINPHKPMTFNHSTDMLDQTRYNSGVPQPNSNIGGSNSSLVYGSSGYYPPYYESSCYSGGGGQAGYLVGGSSSQSLQDIMYSGAFTGVPSLDMYLQAPNCPGYQMLQKISELSPREMVSTILTELCYVNQKHDQRKACLLRLAGVIRENIVDNWDELFNTTLMRLFDTIQDNDAEIRGLALRVIQELSKILPSQFQDFTHITIMKVLQAHKDTDKTVVKTAEECAGSLARNLSQELCGRVLAELIQDCDLKMSLAALKMLLEVTRSISIELLRTSLLPTVVLGLVKATDHTESHIRKASIFCLVEMHRRIGDEIWEHLKSLTSSKARLLQLYIEKNRSGTSMMESSTYT